MGKQKAMTFTWQVVNVVESAAKQEELSVSLNMVAPSSRCFNPLTANDALPNYPSTGGCKCSYLGEAYLSLRVT